MKFGTTKLTIAATLVLAASAAQAAPVTLTFEGAGNQANLNSFYNGGTDSLGNSGTNYGVQFGSNALSIIDGDAGGTGNFANEPSASTVMFFLTGSAVLNYGAGFDTGFSFFYSSNSAASVNVYSGLNATGSLLGSISLMKQANANGCQGDPNGYFCNWSIGSLTFGGLAKSIDFGGTVNQVAFDNITFGSANPVTAVPEPETYALMLAGLGLVGAVARRRKAKQA